MGGFDINHELLSKLADITKEEELLLKGNGVNQALYAKQSDFQVDSEMLLEKGRLITLRPHTRFAPFPRHSHNYVEIMYMCAGSTTHVINGDTQLTLYPGELLFLGRNASHAIARAEVGDVAVNFIVLPGFFDTAFQMIGTENVLGRFLLGTLQRGGEEVSYLHCKSAELLPVQNLVESMVWSLLNKEPNSRRINQVSMGLLLLQLLNHPETITAQGAPGYNSPLVMAALQEIEENFRHAQLTLVAQRFHVSLAYVSGLVRKTTGSSFKELLQQKRLDRAQFLLQETKLSVPEIIEAVGYDNTSYFYRIFKRRFGITPKEYRQKCHTP